MGLLDMDSKKLDDVMGTESSKKAKKQKQVEKPVSDDADIVDIDLSAIKKKRFRIDGDNNRILELNTSDFGVVVRLNETYASLTELATQVAGKGFDFDAADDDVVKLDKASTVIDTIDTQMRKKIDYIFDSNVSEVCAPSGTMYDLINGKFRFEYILEKLAALYSVQIQKEYTKMAARMKKHTGKYHK